MLLDWEPQGARRVLEAVHVPSSCRRAGFLSTAPLSSSRPSPPLAKRLLIWTAPQFSAHTGVDQVVLSLDNRQKREPASAVIRMRSEMLTSSAHGSKLLDPRLRSPSQRTHPDPENTPRMPSCTTLTPWCLPLLAQPPPHPHSSVHGHPV